MVATDSWVFLVYWVPRQPSTPRIAIWRKLKRLGVAQLGDGVVTLPLDPSTQEHLEWIAQEIIDAGGEATVWIATPTVRRFGHQLAESLKSERSQEYRDLLLQAETALTESGSRRKQALRRLRALFRKIESRDHFPPPERARAREILDRLAESLQRETMS